MSKIVVQVKDNNKYREPGFVAGTYIKSPCKVETSWDVITDTFTITIIKYSDVKIVARLK